MGGIISPEPQVPNRGMEFISSHSNDSNADLDNVDDNIEDYISAKWRRCRTRTEALEEYQNDGTLPESADDHMIELREFLDDTRLLHPLGLYAKNGNNIAVLMCWVDIQGFKCIHKDADDYLLSTAQHIYHKYIKAGAVAEIDGIDDDFKDHVKETLVDATADLTDVHRRLFDSLQLKCFERIYHEIFVDFKKSASYQHVIADLKTNFNRIVPEDFDYMEKLGSGTYGIVLHVRKKSTGRHYAMKIQTKIGLLNCYHDALHRVDNEKQVLAACNHPFIISMDYAFQTRTTIMVVMDLGTSGTLLDALDSCEGNRMPEDRVRFYTAEIVLALSHLHRMGMIYRDLKPQNILLKEDGHIKLVDMGGVVDVSGRVLKNCDNLTDEAFLLFAPDKGVEASEGFGTSAKFNVSSNNLKFRDYNNDDSSCAGNGNSTRHGEGSSHRHAVSDNSSGNSGGRNGEDRDSTPSKPAPKLGMLNRTKSVMGTHGYMAPEVLILLKQRSKEKKGYTTSVDWWSLGVVMFKLLTGNLPFPKMNVSELVEWGSSKRIISSNMTKKLTGDNGIVQESSNNINFSRKAVSKLKQLSTSFDFGLSDEELDLMPEQYVKFCTSLAEMRRDYGISTSCVSMILGLLEVNEHKRLGDGPSAKCSIKKHDFLKDIQWELLAQKHILAPYEPIPNAVAKRPAFSSFENALTQCGKIHWLNEYPTRMEQKFFKNWNYVSPHITKVEMGLEQLMEQYDGEFKVKQLLLEQQNQYEQATGGGSVRTPRGGNYFRRLSTGSTGAMSGMSNFLGGMLGSGGKRRASNPALLPALNANNNSRRPSSVSTSSLTNPISARRLSSSSVASVSSGQGITSPNLNSAANSSKSLGHRRNSNVSVVSDCSLSEVAESKRKGSNFAVHVQLMNSLMNEDND